MPPSRSSRQLTFLALATAATAFSLLQSLVSPVLSTLQTSLHTSQSTVTWVFTAWLLSAAVATPLMGRIGDLTGKKRTLTVALAAVALGCLITATAPGIGLVIVGRVLQGLGGAVAAVSFGIIRDEFPRERLPSAVGAMAAVIATGGGLGVVLAGPIVESLGWRWLFWIPMMAVAATAVFAHVVVPESPVRASGRVNWLAAALLAGWLVALLIPVSEAPLWGWTSPTALVLLAAAAVLCAAWIAVELRADSPLIDMRMMRIPAVWTTNLVALLIGAALFSILTFVPEFTQTPAVAGYGFGASVTRAGLLLLPLLIGMAVTGFLSGPLAPVFPVKAQLVSGCALSALACVGLAAYHGQAWQTAAAGGVYGLGLGFAYASMTSLIVQNVPVHQTGVASGMNVNIRTIGGAIGTAVVSSVVTGHLQADGLPRESGFTHGFALLAVFSAVAVAVAVLVPSARRRATAVPSPRSAALVHPAETAVDVAVTDETATDTGISVS